MVPVWVPLRAWASPGPLPGEPCRLPTALDKRLCGQDSPLTTQPWNSRESPISVLLEPSPGLALPSWEGICSF